MKNINELFSGDLERQFRGHMVRHLSDALIGKLQIAQGAGLAMLIGDCRARDNRQAVRIWVARELPEELDRNPQVYLEPLAGKLADRLRRIRENAESFD